MKDLESQWGFSRVEAMADGSLDRKDLRRMRDAMAGDPELQRAVQSAIALRRQLRHLAHVPTPTTLRRRLLEITNDRPSAAPWVRLTAIRAAGFAGAAAIAISIAAFVLLRAAPEKAPPSEVARTKTQAEAVEDFTIAMMYLQKSAAIANAEVTTAVGGSLHDALTREADRAEKREPRKNGG